MRMEINKNGDAIYSKGLKTLITNMDAKVNDKLFEAEASYLLTIYRFFFSKILMNSVVVALFMSTFALAICVVVRELRVYAPMAVKVSASTAGIFMGLLINRSVFWKIFKK